jgi:uncharacterized protein
MSSVDPLKSQHQDGTPPAKSSPRGVFHRLAARQDRLFDRLRHRGAAEAAAGPAAASGFAAIRDAQYALVVTYRRSGEPVPTPMWVAVDGGGRAYARSLTDAGKVARVRRDPHVRLAPCTARGKPTGPFAEADGRVLEPGETDHAERVLDGKYGRGRRMFEGAGTRLGVETVYLEIVPRV